MKQRLAPFLVLLEARYAPLLFAVAPQAYAVYLWLFPHPYDGYGELFAVIGAIGYEAVYVGAIAWAEEGKASRWTWITAAAALIFSIAVAVYVYLPQGLWSILHAGFPLVAFCYTMQLHRMMERLRYDSPRVSDTPPRQDAPQLPEQMTQPGFVYLLRAINEQYKIGRAKDVAARVRNIAGFVPFEVETVHAIATDDMIRLERHLHFVYESAGKRINGEWFHLSQQDVVAIQAIGASLNSDAFDDTLDTLSLIACPPSDTLDTDPITQARLLRQQGVPWREVARKVGMSDATLRRRLTQPEEG